MRAAPPFQCSLCSRHIGKRASHYLLDGGQVVCSRCTENRVLHAEVYPDCPKAWHDLLDHLDGTGTRAGIACVLGLWPTRKEMP